MNVIVIVIVIVHVAVIALVIVNDTRGRDRNRERCTQPFAAPADNARMLQFQNLDVYQRSIEFLALAHRIRARFPKGNADLADQLRRAAQSIPQNIAEGCGRTTRADKAKFFTIARGSAMESAAHLDVMRIEQLIEAEDYDRGVDLLTRVVAMLTKLIEP